MFQVDKWAKDEARGLLKDVCITLLADDPYSIVRGVDDVEHVILFVWSKGNLFDEVDAGKPDFQRRLFEVGTKVLRYRRELKGKKNLKEHWNGPFFVVAHMPNGSCQLALLLVKYHERTLAGL